MKNVATVLLVSLLCSVFAACADNALSAERSSYGDLSSYSRSTGKPVYVKGYYRKDGTYVHSHKRSRPR